MCNRFRSAVGKEWKPGDKLPLELVDGTPAEGVWAGFATEERLAWWIRQPGNVLAQGEEAAEIAERAGDTRELVWGAAPPNARLVYVLEPARAGKNYRLARMITTAANADQVLYFRHGRFPLFGTLLPDGSIQKIPPAKPPASPPVRPPPAQGELF